jgi:8-oxo-dGTP pyrophosphatase MutT (NUDIX family)
LCRQWRERELIDQTNPWELLGTEIGFDSPYYSARRDTVRHHSGHEHPYVHIRTKFRGIAVLPIDADGCTTIVGQFRYPLDRFTWEAVRGGVPLEISALDGAKEELAEETGFHADHWLHLFDLTASPGLSDEICPCFVAWGLRAGTARPAQEETITQRRLPFAEAVSMAIAGEIVDASSVALVLALQARLLRGDLPAGLLALLQRVPE